MRVMAIDPGSEKSAWVLYEDGQVLDSAIEDNESVIKSVSIANAYEWPLAIEMVASYGMPVGKDVFETVFWAGRFAEANQGNHEKVYRKDVKMHLCGSMRAKDANIRQALIDRFGGKEKAVGTKKNPGPLYGIKADMWAALAVAVTYADTGGKS